MHGVHAFSFAFILQDTPLRLKKSTLNVSFILFKKHEKSASVSSLVFNPKNVRLMLVTNNITSALLCCQVQTLEDKYQEVLMLLDETREDAKYFKTSSSAANPNAAAGSSSFFNDSGVETPRIVAFPNSLAAELESSGVTFDPNCSSIPVNMSHNSLTQSESDKFFSLSSSQNCSSSVVSEASSASTFCMVERPDKLSLPTDDSRNDLHNRRAHRFNVKNLAERGRSHDLHEPK